jgi:hypothetical protein
MALSSKLILASSAMTRSSLVVISGLISASEASLSQNAWYSAWISLPASGTRLSAMPILAARLSASAVVRPV